MYALALLHSKRNGVLIELDQMSFERLLFSLFPTEFFNFFSIFNFFDVKKCFEV